MKQTKFIARILYFVSLALAVGYLATVLYSVLCIASGINTQPYGDGKFLHILYPFSSSPFLNIDYNAPYIFFAFLLPLSLYGIFFWLAARVFKVFFQPKLFTRENIVELKRFYIFNIAVPFSIALPSGLFIEVEGMVWGLVVIHFFLGIFIFFLAGIFAQGVTLQNERDLFI